MRLTALARRLRARPVALPPADPGEPQIQEAAQRNRGSLQLRHVDAGSCNGCELEIASIFSPVYDAERFGMRLEASPRHADGLLVTGPVTRNMKIALERTYAATPGPKWVVAVGDCGCGCGAFEGSYAVIGAVDKVLPVDLHIRGCPPRPIDLLRVGGPLTLLYLIVVLVTVNLMF